VHGPRAGTRHRDHQQTPPVCPATPITSIPRSLLEGFIYANALRPRRTSLDRGKALFPNIYVTEHLTLLSGSFLAKAVQPLTAGSPTTVDDPRYPCANVLHGISPRLLGHAACPPPQIRNSMEEPPTCQLTACARPRRHRYVRGSSRRNWKLNFGSQRPTYTHPYQVGANRYLCGVEAEYRVVG